MAYFLSGAPNMSPITWSQNLVLLILPVTLLWAPPAQAGPRHWVALLLVVLALFIRPHTVWGVLIDGGWPDGTVRAWQTLTVLSFQCYAVLALFLVQFVWIERESGRSVAVR